MIILLTIVSIWCLLALVTGVLVIIAIWTIEDRL